MKSDINQEDREKVVIDKYLRGDISLENLKSMLEVIRPKQLKRDSEFTGYA